MDPERCGDYTLTERLNEGGTAEVFLAKTSDQKSVVIRRLRPQLKLQFAKRIEFSRGLEIQTKLNHPNIVRVLEMPKTELVPFAVLEFVDGFNFRHTLTQRETFIEQALPIVEQILRAVSYIHQQGFLHLDLKPENMILSKEGQIKIMDFDLSEPIKKAGYSHSKIRGTVNYLAPEQILKQPLDERTDIFSLGIMMYEIFTGQKPMPALTKQQTLDFYSNVESPFPPPIKVAPEISPIVNHVIKNCIQKKKDLRYPNIDLILHELHTGNGLHQSSS